MANLLKVAVVCVFVVCLTIAVAVSKSDSSYIDPTDMLNFDAVNIRMIDKNPGSSDSPTDSKAGSETCPPCSVCPTEGKACPQSPPCPKAIEDSVWAEMKEEHATTTLLLRQYSLSLVRLMETQVGSTSQPTLIDVRVIATYHSLEKLRKFGEGTSSDVHMLYETLTSLMQYAMPVSEGSVLSRFYWLEDRLGLSCPMMVYAIVLILSSVLLVVTVGRIRWRKELLIHSLVGVFIWSVVLTMIEMYQEKLAEQEELLMESVKKHCPKVEEMTPWERISLFVTSPFYFKDDKCKKFMEAIIVHPMVAASPMQAIAVVLVKSVVIPMEYIGQGIKSFLVGLLKDLPAQYQAFVLVCLFVLLILWPLLLMGYNFNLFYIINIGPARVEKEIKYVTAEPDSTRPIQSHDGSSDQWSKTPADPIHARDPQNVLASEDRGFLPYAQPPVPQIRQKEKTERSTSIPIASQAYSSLSLEANSNVALYVRPNQFDGGDTQTQVIGAGGVQDKEVTSSQALACGDRESSEQTTAGLCRKLSKVYISEERIPGHFKLNTLEKCADVNGPENCLSEKAEIVSENCMPEKAEIIASENCMLGKAEMNASENCMPEKDKVNVSEHAKIYKSEKSIPEKTTDSVSEKTRVYFSENCRPESTKDEKCTAHVSSLAAVTPSGSLMDPDSSQTESTVLTDGLNKLKLEENKAKSDDHGIASNIDSD